MYIVCSLKPSSCFTKTNIYIYKIYIHISKKYIYIYIKKNIYTYTYYIYMYIICSLKHVILLHQNQYSIIASDIYWCQLTAS